MRVKQVLDIISDHAEKLQEEMLKATDGKMDGETLTKLTIQNPFLAGQIHALGSLSLDVMLKDMECEEKDARRRENKT